MLPCLCHSTRNMEALHWQHQLLSLGLAWEAEKGHAMNPSRGSKEAATLDLDGDEGCLHKVPNLQPAVIVRPTGNARCGTNALGLPALPKVCPSPHREAQRRRQAFIRVRHAAELHPKGKKTDLAKDHLLLQISTRLPPELPLELHLRASLGIKANPRRASQGPTNSPGAQVQKERLRCVAKASPVFAYNTHLHGTLNKFMPLLSPSIQLPAVPRAPPGALQSRRCPEPPHFLFAKLRSEMLQARRHIAYQELLLPAWLHQTQVDAWARDS
mmetsp:Transcript_14038/g.31977  ORF Transcript_14038/g.31977 Transcript_14038/m.31977 type:complete len:271 (-) Transcript_14038:61-873(-)